MANIKRPEGIEIAALREKKVEYFDLMTPGSGTPWEERGQVGMIGAFIKTAKMSLFSPGQLAHQIRRPETKNDVNGFLLICSFFIGLGWVVASIIYWKAQSARQDLAPEASVYFLGVALKFFIGWFSTFLFLNFYCSIFSKLVDTELKGKAPPALIYNVHAYAFGPAIFAVIPFVGPAIAALWLLINFCIVSVKRLRLSKGGAIISAIVSFVVVIAIATVLVYGFNFIFNTMTSGGGLAPVHND